MSLQHLVLGEPGRDNALFVRVASGQAIHRFLFDCGEGCLSTLAVSEIHAIDTLFFSHLHIDHVAGFDAFLRLNFARPEAPARIAGPEGTIRAIHHRLQGVTWNLVGGQSGAIEVADILPDRIVTARFLTAEGFAHAHPAGDRPFDGVVHEGDDLKVEARIMDHGTPCVAYLIRERPRTNVDTARLAELGLPPGRWIQQLKDETRPDDEPVAVGAEGYSLGDLRRLLLVRTPGASLAYLTDFALAADPAEQALRDMLQGCEAIVGEASYREADAELAHRHRHFTGPEMGRLAASVGARKLVLFHVSDRYTREGWRELLAEVRATFPAARFPPSWGLD